MWKKFTLLTLVLTMVVVMSSQSADAQNIAYVAKWDITTAEVDPFIQATVTHVGDAEFLVTMQSKRKLEKNYLWNTVLCDIPNVDTIEVKDLINSTREEEGLIDKTEIDLIGLPTEWCGNKNVGYVIKSFQNETQLQTGFTFTIPQTVKNFTLKIGNQSQTIIGGTGSTNNLNDENPNVLKDRAGNYHIVMHDGGQDLRYGRSTDGGETWSVSDDLFLSTLLDDMNILQNTTGGLWLLWNDDTGGLEDEYFMTSTNDGFTWSTAQIITGFDGDANNNFQDMAATIDSNDVIHICVVTTEWDGVTANDFLMYANYTSSGWSGRVNVSTTSTDDVDKCDIGVDSDNLPYIVATGTDGDDLEIWNKGVWGDNAEIVIDLSSSVSNTAIFIDDLDNIFVTAQYGSNIKIFNSTEADPTSWTEITLSTDTDQTNPVPIRVLQNEIIVLSSFISTSDGQSNISSFNSTDGGATYGAMVPYQTNWSASGVSVSSSPRGDNTRWNKVDNRFDYIYYNSTDDNLYFGTFPLQGIQIGFIDPTPADNTAQDDNFTFIRAEINESIPLDSVTLEWNGTNITVWGDGLVGLWHLDNDTSDSSGNGNDGTNNGANCSSSVTGRFAGACSFDGVDNAITLSDVNLFGSIFSQTEFSIDFWFNSEDTADAKVMINGAGSFPNTIFMEVQGDGTIETFIRDGSSNLCQIITTDTYEDQQWHHFAYIRNGTTNQSLYIDTVFVDSCGTNTGAITTTDSEISNDGATIAFAGRMDEIRLWNRTLSPRDLDLLYRSQIGKYFANITEIDNGTYDYRMFVNQTDGVDNVTETRRICIGADFSQDCAGPPDPFNVTATVSPSTNFSMDNNTNATLNYTLTCSNSGCGDVNLTLMNFTDLIIPVGSGSPFFTGTNPLGCNLPSAGSTCSVNFTINASGLEGERAIFFGNISNSTQGFINRGGNVNVTITLPSVSTARPNGTEPPTSTHFYPFNSSFNDAVGNLNMVATTGSPGIIPPGFIGNGSLLLGGNTGGSPDSIGTSVFPNDSIAYSFSLMVNITNMSIPGNLPTVFEQGETGEHGSTIIAFYNSTPDELNVRWLKGDGAAPSDDHEVLYSLDNWPAREWMHLALIANESSGNISMWIDGINRNSTILGNPGFGPESGLAKIGSHDSGNSNFFPGMVDNFKVWINYTLNESEIIWLSEENITVAAPVDSCTDFENNVLNSVDCTDACTIDSTVDKGGADIEFTGAGQIRITADITNFGDIQIINSCNVICDGGCFT